MSQYNKTTKTHTDHIRANNMLIARIESLGSLADPSTTPFSPMPKDDFESGDIRWMKDYMPYGAAYSTTEYGSADAKDGLGYTGHVNDGNGLVYMQARYYDPVIGRFLSNDSVGFSNVHNFNRYAYANNNPYRYIDPDGRAAGKVNEMRQVVGGVLTVGLIDAYQAAWGKHNDFARGLASEILSEQPGVENMTTTQKMEFKNGVRHVAWQASLTLEEGLDQAKTIGNLHELGEEQSQDSQIDQSNNKVGQSIGSSVKGVSDIKGSIQSALKAGNM